MKRILRDPHGKDRDLRSAWRAGEISRNNSEPRRSRGLHEPRKTYRNQGEFLGRIFTRLSPREYGPEQQGREWRI